MVETQYGVLILNCELVPMNLRNNLIWQHKKLRDAQDPDIKTIPL